MVLTAKSRSRLISAVYWLLAASMPGAVCAQTTPAPGTVPQVRLPSAFNPAAPNHAVSGSAVVSAPVPGGAGNVLTVNQSSQKAILHWNNFNIGSGSEVKFVQPSTSAQALNRIFQGDPSIIQGRLTANGQVFLINQNGIIFGNGAQINTHSLLASTLNITDQDFNNGILSVLTEVSPNPVFSVFGDGSGNISIEPLAVLNSAEGGRVMVLAPQVENKGKISTPGGQTILAAADKVYLQASSDPSLRGLLIEVDTQGDTQKTVTNLGEIVAERGNVTLVGMAVNQMNRVSATTSVNENGSIRLLARSNTQPNGNRNVNPQYVTATQTGSVTFGKDSTTQITPEAGSSDTTTRGTAFKLDGTLTNPSRVEAMGKRIVMEQGSQIKAPSGEVKLTALSNPSTYNQRDNALDPIQLRSEARIYLDRSASIDVSGGEAVLPMERNSLEVELRGNELRDFPLQRDGFLRGKKVTVDVRKGTQLADIQGALDNVQIGVKEVLTVGGSVALKSEGDVILREGAAVDVSGGLIRYLDGFVSETKVSSEGKVFALSSAPADLRYDSFADVYTRAYKKWGVTESWGSATSTFQPGYLEGRNAGAIHLQGEGLVLDAALRASTVQGLFQRERLPASGALVVGARERLENTESLPNLSSPRIEIRSVVAPQAFGLTDILPSDLVLALAAPTLTRAGFGRLDLYSNSEIVIPSGVALDLPVRGQMALTARSVEVDGRVSAPGGSISLTTVQVANETPGASHDLRLGAAGKLLTRGDWVNDNPLLNQSPTLAGVAVDGGTATLRSFADIELAAGSVVDVSGGGWLNDKGRLRSGNAGSIRVSGGTGEVGMVPSAAVRLEGDLLGHALARGGAMSLTARRIAIGAEPPQDGDVQTLALTPAFFQRGGFHSYNLTSNAGDAAIADGTSLRLSAMNLVLDSSASGQATGADMLGFASPMLLPEHLRRASSFSFNVSGGAYESNASNLANVGVVRIGAGAQIETEVRGQISFSAPTSVLVEGGLVAPGGAINLSISSDRFNEGFLQTQKIWLGESAALITTGKAITTPNDLFRRGDVLRGGDISLAAGRGFVVTAPGSILDASGAVATFDLLSAGGDRAVPTPVGSSAGSIRLDSAWGLIHRGEMRAQPGMSGNRGGTVEIVLQQPSIDPAFFDPGARRTLQFLANGVEQLSLGFGAEDPVPAQNYAIAAFTPSAFAQGFDALRAQTPGLGLIQLDSGMSLDLRRSISLDTPTIAVLGHGKSELSAAYLALRNSSVVSVAPTPGDAQLQLNATSIDIIGDVALSGLRAAGLNASEDVQLRGSLVAGKEKLQGSLNIAGDLNLRARQIYPATFTDFRFGAVGEGRTITILPGAAVDVPVMSAAGVLRIDAANIYQGGVLKAPFGSIELNALNDLTLAPGSVTTASAQGQVIPFGTLQNGVDWFYNAGTLKAISAPPQKQVRLTGGSVRVEAGSVVDIAGGGDLYAYEFVPGPGGSSDILASTVAGSATTTFAVLPTLKSLYPAYDQQAYAGSALAPGDNVTLLDSANGLAAGSYAVLPARYGLLPGAFLVTQTAAYPDLALSQAVQFADGSTAVAGYRSTAGTDVRDSRRAGFIVRPSNWAAAQAEYTPYKAEFTKSFFAARAQRLEASLPRLPADAGRLVLGASQSLLIDGDIRSTAASGGRGAEVDVSAERLAVVQRKGTVAGAVEVEVGALQRLGAESLLLGGVRSDGPDGSTVEVGTHQLTVANDSGSVLQAPELILAANDNITIKAGSALDGSGAISSPTKKIVVNAVGFTISDTNFDGVIDAQDSNRGDVNGDGLIDALDSIDRQGALLRLTSAQQVDIDRGAAVGRARGSLLVEQGSQLRAHKALLLDATRENTTLGAFDLGEQAAASLSAGRISLGETAGVTAGLVLSNDRLAGDFRRVSALTLRSYSSIDLYGDVSLGRDATGAYTLQQLTIDAAGLAGRANAAKTATLAAKAIVLNNSGNVSAPFDDLGSGSLTLIADSLRLGAVQPNAASTSFKVAGFADTSLFAQREIVSAGVGSVIVDGNLGLTSSRVTGARGSDKRVEVAGTLSIGVGANPESNLTAIEDLGAKLQLSANRITHAGRIELPSGQLALRATGGDSTDSIALEAGALIDLSGVKKRYFDVDAYTPGGQLRVSSANGNVLIQEGALVDVSAPQGNRAGSIEIDAANASVVVGGELRGRAIAGERQGRIALDAGQMQDVASLLQKVATGGFSEEIALRLRSGDIALTSDAIVARQIKLIADQGAIDVATRLDAAGARGGRIELHAGSDVQLRAGALLNAAAGVSGQSGGSVVLSAGGGRIVLAPASQINVSGGAGSEESGTVLLRAARMGIAAGSDVNVDPIGATITGASRVSIEAFKSYTANVIDGGAIATWKADSAAFMANTAAIKSRLGIAGNDKYHLRPGVEVRSSGDITVMENWSLHDWRYDPDSGVEIVDPSRLSDGATLGGKPLASGVLGLRALGDIKFQASLSDGFDGTTPLSALSNGGASWSYRIAAGADLGSADPLAVMPVDSVVSGNLVLDPGQLIRTGTGEIQIAAARDLRLGDAQSVVYTAGVPVARRDGPSAATAAYAGAGGDIRVVVGGDLVGERGNQLITAWLHRDGRRQSNSTSAIEGNWWIDYRYFQQGLAALGGGSVDVRAGGSLREFSVAVASSRTAEGLLAGGGDLSIHAGGDILGGTYYVSKGVGDISAGGELSRGVSNLYPVLALGSGNLTISASQDLTVETVLNPTVITRGGQQTNPTRPAYFFTYNESDSVSLQSLSGDISLNHDLSALADASKFFARNNAGIPDGDRNMLIVYPPTLNAISLQGSILVNGGPGVTLYPSAKGSLSLLAERDVRMAEESIRINLSDADASVLPTVTRVQEVSVLELARLLEPGATGSDRDTHARVPVHAGDSNPALVYARAGDIMGGKYYLNKSSRLKAGRDYSDVFLVLQHADDQDVSEVFARRDIVFTAPRDSSNNPSLNLRRTELIGEGRLNIQAGRNIDLGSSVGVVSSGNINNANLPERGADVTLMAGVGDSANFAGLVETYKSKYVVGSEEMKEVAASILVRRQDPRLHEQDPNVRERVLRDAQVELLQELEQSPDDFGREIFFNELKLAGRTGKFDSGDKAIDALFPQERYSGNVSLFFSQVATQSGGDIDILVPGGSVNAGLASPPSGFSKPASQLGVVAQGVGSVRSFTSGDFIVNQSRVFTLRGGDILMWSSDGNIDAGRGAKSTVATPPPVLTVDSDGSVRFNFQGAATGAGIRVLLTAKGDRPGAVDLIAPSGEVNAGDAGIVSAGNLNIAALRVVGADNIQVGGVSTGVPVVDAAGLGAAVAGLSNVGNEAAKAADQAAQQALSSSSAADTLSKTVMPSFITVEVLDDEDPEDVKRRRAAPKK